MENKNITSESAANLVLGIAGDGDKFSIKTGLFEFRFQLRPLWTFHVVKISREISKMQEIDPSADAFAEMFKRSGNYKNVCNSIAIAALFKEWKIFLFKRIVSRLIMKSEPVQVQQLWDMVKDKTDPKRFFFIMVSAKGFNKFQTKKSREGTVGSE